MSVGSGGTAERARDNIGLRRVQWVTVRIDGDHAWAAAVGICHRLPRRVPISMRMAAELANAGVPVLVERVAPKTAA